VPSHDPAALRTQKARAIRLALGNDLRRHRTDAGLPLGAVAGAAGISRSHLCELETGKADASLPTLAALADVLGADLSIRLHPNTGPRIRDHIQARIVEELLRVAHPRWRAYAEVPVYRPARGRVDVVYHDPAAVLMVATEVHSQINRVEQQLGWANMKTDSLPSADLWRHAVADQVVSRLLVLRSTRTMRELVGRFEHTFRSAYPASAASVYAALVSRAPWPGPGVLWAAVSSDGVRILDHPPRGILLGR
jgi:transcriptional regulator with XRE-family HTH domain